MHSRLLNSTLEMLILLLYLIDVDLWTEGVPSIPKLYATLMQPVPGTGPGAPMPAAIARGPSIDRSHLQGSVPALPHPACRMSVFVNFHLGTLSL